LDNLKKWDVEDKERMEKRREDLAVEQQREDEQEMRRVAECREEKEKKLERARRANGPVALSSLGVLFEVI
jgi:hypothetical protein